MELFRLLDMSNELPHEDEGAKAYIDRISGGFVNHFQVARELKVSVPQIYRWYSSKPHLIQSAIRSLLFQQLGEQSRHRNKAKNTAS